MNTKFWNEFSRIMKIEAGRDPKYIFKICLFKFHQRLNLANLAMNEKFYYENFQDYED